MQITVDDEVVTADVDSVPASRSPTRLPEPSAIKSQERALHVNLTPGVQFPAGAVSARRGISNRNHENLGNAGRHRRTYRQERGRKEALAVRLGKLVIGNEKTLQGVAELARCEES